MFLTPVKLITVQFILFSMLHFFYIIEKNKKEANNAYKKVILGILHSFEIKNLKIKMVIYSFAYGP